MRRFPSGEAVSTLPDLAAGVTARQCNWGDLNRSGAYSESAGVAHRRGLVPLHNTANAGPLLVALYWAGWLLLAGLVVFLIVRS